MTRFIPLQYWCQASGTTNPILFCMFHRRFCISFLLTPVTVQCLLLTPIDSVKHSWQHPMRQCVFSSPISFLGSQRLQWIVLVMGFLLFEHTFTPFCGQNAPWGNGTFLQHQTHFQETSRFSTARHSSKHQNLSICVATLQVMPQWCAPWWWYESYMLYQISLPWQELINIVVYIRVYIWGQISMSPLPLVLECYNGDKIKYGIIK